MNPREMEECKRRIAGYEATLSGKSDSRGFYYTPRDHVDMQEISRKLRAERKRLEKHSAPEVDSATKDELWKRLDGNGEPWNASER